MNDLVLEVTNIKNITELSKLVEKILGYYFNKILY